MRYLVLMLVSFSFSTTGLALDFEKEIAKQNQITVEVVQDLQEESSNGESRTRSRKKPTSLKVALVEKKK